MACTIHNRINCLIFETFLETLCKAHDKTSSLIASQLHIYKNRIKMQSANPEAGVICEFTMYGTFFKFLYDQEFILNVPDLFELKDKVKAMNASKTDNLNVYVCKHAKKPNFYEISLIIKNEDDKIEKQQLLDNNVTDTTIVPVDPESYVNTSEMMAEAVYLYTIETTQYFEHNIGQTCKTLNDINKDANVDTSRICAIDIKIDSLKKQLVFNLDCKDNTICKANHVFIIDEKNIKLSTMDQNIMACHKFKSDFLINFFNIKGYDMQTIAFVDTYNLLKLTYRFGKNTLSVFLKPLVETTE